MSNSQARQFDPRQYVTQHATERDIIILKEIFDTFDTDEDGVLAPRDLLQAMSKYNGYHPKRNYIYQVMAPYDKDQSGNIDFKEFVRMVYDQPYEKDTSQSIKRVFNEIDFQNKGYLQAQDLRNLAMDLKQQLTQQQIRVIMNKLDPKKEGKISLQTFMQFNREKIF